MLRARVGVTGMALELYADMNESMGKVLVLYRLKISIVVSGG